MGPKNLRWNNFWRSTIRQQARLCLSNRRGSYQDPQKQKHQAKWDKIQAIWYNERRLIRSEWDLTRLYQWFWNSFIRNSGFREQSVSSYCSSSRKGSKNDSQDRYFQIHHANMWLPPNRQQWKLYHGRKVVHWRWRWMGDPWHTLRIWNHWSKMQ